MLLPSPPIIPRESSLCFPTVILHRPGDGVERREICFGWGQVLVAPQRPKSHGSWCASKVSAKVQLYCLPQAPSEHGHPAPCNSNSCGMLSKRAGHREHTNMKRVPSVLGMDTWCFDGVRQGAWAGLGSGILNSEQEMCPDSEWCHLLSKVCQSRSIVAPQGLAQSLEHSIVVQSLSRVQLLVTPWTAVLPASLFFTIPGVYSNSYSSSQWCHPTTSSCCHFSSCSQSFPASGSFPVGWLFISGGQSVGVSASVLPMTIQGWFPLGLTGLISLQSKGLSRVFSNTTVQKNQFFGTQPSLWMWSSSHIHTWLLGKP